jgi:hypothetical protein
MSAMFPSVYCSWQIFYNVSSSVLLPMENYGRKRTCVRILGMGITQEILQTKLTKLSTIYND